MLLGPYATPVSNICGQQSANLWPDVCCIQLTVFTLKLCSWCIIGMIGNWLSKHLPWHVELKTWQLQWGCQIKIWFLFYADHVMYTFSFTKKGWKSYNPFRRWHASKPSFHGVQATQYKCEPGGGRPLLRYLLERGIYLKRGMPWCQNTEGETHNTFLYICCHCSIVIPYLIGQTGKYHSQYINLYLETISLVWQPFGIAPESWKGHGGC